MTSRSPLLLHLNRTISRTRLSAPSSVSFTPFKSSLSHPTITTLRLYQKTAVRMSSSLTNFTKEPAIAYPQERFHIVQPVSPGSYLGPIDPSLPGADKPPLLFQPFKVKNLTMANRVVVAPMCMYSAQDGFMNAFHVAHLGSFAIHGAGLILTEASAVQPR
jgi:hypothetical protein